MSYKIARDGEVSAGPFPLGMNNKQRDHSLPEGALRNAVNVDIDNSGRGRRRKGITKVYSGLGTKGGYKRYFIEGLELCYLNTDNTKTVVYSGIYGSTYTYDYFNGIVYFSDGVVNLKLDGTTATRWGMPIPAKPVLSKTTGTYGEGTYLASYSWIDADGVESGGSDIASVTLYSEGGIVFNNLPSLIPEAVSLRIYLSTPNGKELYAIADTTALAYSISSGIYDDSMLAENLFLSQPPPASIIRFYNGRAYVVDASGTVWYSEPFSYDNFNLTKNYMLFPSNVSIMEPVKNGIFFATDYETFFYGGNPEDGFSIDRIFEYGGLKGTGQRVLNTSSVTWMSQRGVIIGHKDGSYENLQEENVATETGASGAQLVREQDGIRQIVTVINNPTISPLAASSFIEAEIIRRA